MALRDVACEDCNVVLPLQVSSFNQDKPNVWYPGKKCPMCGSEKFYPVITITDTDRQQARQQQVSLKRRLLMNPWTGVAAFIVTVIIVLWPESAEVSTEKALFFCEKCHALFFAKNSLQRPLKCPECSERAGHRAAACERCRLVYSQHQKECPHCRSTSCTPVMTLEQATQARKDHEQYLKLEQEMVEGDGSQEEE